MIEKTKSYCTLIVFRGRTFGPQRHQDNQRPASRESRTLRARTHAGQVVAVIPPPTSGGAARSAPVLRCRNSSCLTEAGERAGGGGGARQSLHRPGRKAGSCAAALPLSWSPRAPRARLGAAGAPGGTELGGEARLALGSASAPGPL